MLLDVSRAPEHLLRSIGDAHRAFLVRRDGHGAQLRRV
jgi:hypothetical protein